MNKQPASPAKAFSNNVIRKFGDFNNPISEYVNGRDMNLVKMILNLAHNNSNDYQKPADVYDVYSKMTEMDYDAKVRDSIDNSKTVMLVPPKRHSLLSSLIENDSKSFLALPLLGKGHLWSILIRKTDEGYSALIINKGLRFWHDPVEEFVFSKANPKNLENLGKALSYAGSFGMQNIEDVYRTFISNSDVQYNMNVNAGPQKVGNCFTKNIQAAIKIAQATADMPVEEFRKLRLPTPYTPSGTDTKDKVTFKWKNFETEKMQLLFVEKIAKRNPSIRKRIDEQINIYTFNKHLRTNFKSNIDPLKALEMSFEKKDEISKLPEFEKTKTMLKMVSPFNFGSYQDKLTQIVKSTKNPEYIGLFNELIDYSKLGAYMSRGVYISVFMEARHDTLKSLYRIYDKANANASLPDKERLKEVLKQVDIYSLKRYENAIKTTCNEVYGAEQGAVAFENACTFASAKMKDVQSNWQLNLERLNSLSDHFPLVAQSIQSDISHTMTQNAKYLLYDRNNPNEAIKFLNRALDLNDNHITNYLKGLCLAAQNNPIRAVESFSKALQKNPLYTNALLARANMFLSLNDKSSANKDFSTAKKVEPNAIIPQKADRFLKIPFAKNKKSNEKTNNTIGMEV